MSFTAPFLIFSGNANKQLAHDVCASLNTQLSPCFVSAFSDGETRVEIEVSVRGRDIFIIQPTCNPANVHLMELLIMADALRRASAGRITAVIPYYGYSRQERKSGPRMPITAKLVADLLTSAGFNRILSFDLHAEAIQGFFNIPFDHLYARSIFVEQMLKLGIPPQDLVVVSPDAGGVHRARKMAQALQCGLAIIDKHRDRPGQSQVMNLIGDVSGKVAFVLDDICDTAGTFVQAAQAAKDFGAASVYGAVTHPVLSGAAVERLGLSCVKKLFVTNSIPISSEAHQSEKVEVLSIASLIAQAVQRIHSSVSLSDLF